MTLSLVEEEEVVRCTQMITEKAFDLILAEESVAILESTKLKLKESKNVLHAGLVFQQEKSDVEVEAL